MGYYSCNKVTIERKERLYVVTVYDDELAAFAKHAGKEYVPEVTLFPFVEQALEFMRKSIMQLSM